MTQKSNMATRPFEIQGWRETVISVSNLETYKSFFREVAGWEIVVTGETSREQIAHWGLNPEKATAQWALMRNPGSESGYARLVQFAGVAQQQIRSNTQMWDSGGILDINVRVRDLDKNFAQMQALGWQAGEDPLQFEFGPFTVREWIARGPDGLMIALIQRLQPPLEGWPHLRKLSRTFNSSQVVRDMEAAKRFYIDALGFKVYLHHRGASSEPGENVFGLPQNIATREIRNIYILHPEGGNEGSVELVHFESLRGRDVAARAKPPNLGALTLRFPVKNIEALARRLGEHKVEITAPAAVFDIPPYGQSKVLGVQAPDGAWLEFYEPLAP